MPPIDEGGRWIHLTVEDTGKVVVVAAGGRFEDTSMPSDLNNVKLTTRENVHGVVFVSYGNGIPAGHVVSEKASSATVDTFTLTVEGAANATAAGLSGAGDFHAGSTVAVNAGTNGEFIFSHWTVEPASVTIHNAGYPHQQASLGYRAICQPHTSPGSLVAFFEMPAEPVTVTANWYRMLDRPDFDESEWPKFNATFGQTLDEFNFANFTNASRTVGTFRWDVPDTTIEVGDVGTQTYPVIFTPDDPDYHELFGFATFTVEQATAAFVCGVARSTVVNRGA
jgi:hypothetical protein